MSFGAAMNLEHLAKKAEERGEIEDAKILRRAFREMDALDAALAERLSINADTIRRS